MTTTPLLGISCYSRNLDYKRFREIADENNAMIMSDMAHISGLHSLVQKCCNANSTIEDSNTFISLNLQDWLQLD